MWTIEYQNEQGYWVTVGEEAIADNAVDRMQEFRRVHKTVLWRVRGPAEIVPIGWREIEA